VRGLFAWSFYSDPSADHWAAALLEWARQEFSDVFISTDPPASQSAGAVLALLRNIPLLLVMDGLEVMQDASTGDSFGRLLDGLLRATLTGACYPGHSSLILLTSRFPFADLEAFDGGAVRILEVPSFTSTEGSRLLAAAGGGWLAEAEREDLVMAVNGHALAISVLAGALAVQPPSGDIATLRSDLTGIARTSTRVNRVLRFYSERLSEPDRYLTAAVSLFVRPVTARAVLEIARHVASHGGLARWSEADVVSAARLRLPELVTVHTDGTLSAHPLVRDRFRPLVMGVAKEATNIALADLPRGQVTTRADALRVVEAIELLIDAAQWTAADSLYQNRLEEGRVWKHLPAARLGQRAASAFVGTADRRDACAEYLSPDRRDHYMTDVGLYASNSGDLVTAREHLEELVRDSRSTADWIRLPSRLENLASCLGRMGEISSARDAAADALNWAEGATDWRRLRDAHAYAAWLAGIAGDTAQAERQFKSANQIQRANAGKNLYSVPGVLWAEWLINTRRIAPADKLMQENREICNENGWNEDVGRCDRLLGRIAYTTGGSAAASERLQSAAECFRDGDYLVELALTLIEMADCIRILGNLDEAERHASEAITIAAPRGLIPVQCSGLAAKGRVYRERYHVSKNPTHIARGRDAADAALRLAMRHQLPWCELDALLTHDALDRVEGAARDFAIRTSVLQTQLIPATLDSDPLTDRWWQGHT
jgi:tetratricopeptide (TPR) repeat protein